MSSILLLSIGILVVMLFWVAGRRSAESAGFIGRAQGDSEYQVRLPRPDLLRRCLSEKDVAFAANLRSPAILRLLLHERRRLALEWLRSTRREASRLYRLHVLAVRHAEDLRPAAEAKLLIQVCLFLAVHEIMSVLVQFYGPFRTQAFLRSMGSLAEILSILSGRIADTVTPDLVPSPGAAR